MAFFRSVVPVLRWVLLPSDIVKQANQKGERSFLRTLAIM